MSPRARDMTSPSKEWVNHGSGPRRWSYAPSLADPESEAVPKQEQLPSDAEANIDHSYPLRDDVVKEVKLGAQEGRRQQCRECR